jgi:hypothetical protein
MKLLSQGKRLAIAAILQVAISQKTDEVASPGTLGVGSEEQYG